MNCPYPTPMFVSLVTHGLQAVVISLIVHKCSFNKEVVRASIGVAIGAVVGVVVCYQFGIKKIFKNL